MNRPKTISQIFAQNLRQERTRLQLSLQTLAAKAGLSFSYISMLERGERMPPLETVELVAKALGMDPVAMLGGGARRR